MSLHSVAEQVEQLFSSGLETTFPPGHIVIAAHSTPPGIFYVRRGRVKQYLLTRDGRELIVNIFKPGSFFSMMWGLGDRANIYFFETMEETTLSRRTKDSVQQFLKQHPDVLMDLLARLYVGLDGLLPLLAYSAIGTSEQKVIASLIMIAKRFGSSIPEGTLISDVTQKEIGLFSGTSRETVTRILRLFAKKGVILTRRRGLVIKDMTTFESLLLADTTLT